MGSSWDSISMKVRCGNKTCRKYIEKSGASRSGLSYYCDSDCLSESQKKKSKTSPAKNRSSIKQAHYAVECSSIIRTKDEGRCRLCGKSTGLAVHHIYYRSDQTNKPWENEYWNQITLCNRPCHLEIVHGDKKKWTPILLGLTWVREVEQKNISLEQLERMINGF